MNEALLVGIIGFILLFVLMAFGMPIGWAMVLTGILGFIYLRGFEEGLQMLGGTPYRSAAYYTMSTIPLFVLMGNLAYYSGISSDLYSVSHKWLGRLPGGLAIATMAGCAGFSAICGSSVATAVTIGAVALPEMKKFNYDPRLATGCVAAGGTLGILIPPSLAFIIYSMLTSESIGALFIAGIMPGIVLAIMFMITIYVMCIMNPSLGPKGDIFTWKQRLASLKDVWTLVVMVIVVLGGMYIGIFTPTEAAGVGAFMAFILMIIKRQLNRKNLSNALIETGKLSSVMFLILMGATAFGYMIALSRIPHELAAFITQLQVPALMVLILILIVYLVLGCLMDTITMVVLTVPIFFPIIVKLGFDPIWFGVIVVIMEEMSVITPPVGVNVFAIGGVAKDVPMEKIFQGIFPFLVPMVALMALLIIFPSLATWLPSMMR